MRLSTILISPNSLEALVSVIIGAALSGAALSKLSGTFVIASV